MNIEQKTAKTIEHSFAFKRQSGKQAMWVFRNSTLAKATGTTLQATGTLLEGGSAIGSVEWMSQRGKHQIVSTRGSSKTSIVARYVSGDRYAIEIRVDDRSISFEIGATTPGDYANLENVLSSEVSARTTASTQAESAALLSELPLEMLRQSSRVNRHTMTGGQANSAAKANDGGGKTLDECKSDFDGAMSDIAQDLVADSTLTAVGLGLGWSGVGLVLAGAAFVYSAYTTDRDLEQAEESYEECKDNASDAPE